MAADSLLWISWTEMFCRLWLRLGDCTLCKNQELLLHFGPRRLLITEVWKRIGRGLALPPFRRALRSASSHVDCAMYQHCCC